MRTRPRQLIVMLVIAPVLSMACACGGGGGVNAAPGGGMGDATGDVGVATDIEAPLDAPGGAEHDGADDSTAAEDVAAGDAGSGFEPTPCTYGHECPSGWCVDGPSGGLCTVACAQECPAGWTCQESAAARAAGAPTLCVPLFGNVCRPCNSDGECGEFVGALAARCLDYGPIGHFCGSACDTAAECPGGYACVDGQCTLSAGECVCTARYVSEGAQTRCSNVNEIGACAGNRHCAEGGLTPCDARTPVPESCNGIDDECDGETDEGLPDTDQNGTSDCLGDDDDSDGTPDPEDCAPFDPLIHPGAAELCNGVDEDCDGLTDEAEADAGGPGAGTVDCGVGVCAHAVSVCAGTCDAQEGAAVELCNGVDDDCDGLTDEGSDDGVALTTCGVGACLRTVSACVQGQPAACDPLEGALVEICNGVDDDCDGLTDDGLGATTCGTGACQTTAPACVNGQPNSCVAGEAGAEACNGVDDDCDGLTDEADAEGCTIVYQDGDNDGYGGPITACRCGAPTGYTTEGGDCNDAVTSINPGAPDLCDDKFADEDCDGYPDEGCYLASCKELRDQKGIKTSGVYSLDIDGIGGAFPSQVFCDMTTAGGAWTKVNGLAPELVTALVGTSGRQLLKCFTSDAQNRYIVSPPFASPWSWSRTSLEKAAGTWVVNGNDVTCGAETDYDDAACGTFWGVGCSNGVGQSNKLIPGIVDSPTPKTCAAATSPDTPAAHTGGVFTICSGSNWNYWSIFVRAE